MPRSIFKHLMSRRSYTVGAILALSGVYFCAGKFGLSLAFVNASASAVWPPTGLALAALLLGGHRLWPGIFLGAVAVNLVTLLQSTSQGAVTTAFGIAIGNTLEAVLGAALVQRFANGVNAFERTQTVFKFVALAAIVSTLVSATLGVTSLCLAGRAGWHEYGSVWLTWWLGDMVSDLIVAPLLLTWLAGGFSRLKLVPRAEAACLLLALLAIGGIVFLGKNPFSGRNQPLEYLAIPPLLWAAFRFGSRGAVTTAAIMSGIAVWGTLDGFGPFATGNRNESLLLLQSFMGTITLTALVLATVISERKKAEQRLQIQDAVSRVLAESPTLLEATPKILRALCQRGEWETGAIWRVERPAKELSCVEMWHSPSEKLPEFETMTRRIRFAPGVGLPGRVWSSGKPAWVPDVTKDANFPRAAVAAKEGLHAAFCFPLKVGEEAVGVIECFSREVREPDDDFLQMLAAIGGQLGQFIERKRAEEALRQSEALFRQLADAMPQIVWAARPSGDIDYYNQRWYEFTGFGEDYGEQVWKRILHPEDVKRCVDTYSGAIRSGRPYQIEYRFKDRQTGGHRWFLGRALPVRDEAGQIIRWFGTCTDIDELKRAEAAQGTLVAIVQSSEDAIISKNLHGIVTSWNAGAERLFGYQAEEMIGQPIFRIIPHENREEEAAMLERLRRGERIEQYESVRITKDGQPIDVSLTISPIRDAAGAIVGASKIARDITERKKAEKALQDAKDQLARHAEELEALVAERTARLSASNAELEAFSYSLSHDMRAPLRAIQSFAQIVLADYGDKIGSPGSDYLQRTASAAARLDRLIQDVLAISRLSREEMEIENVNVEKLIREIIQERPELQSPRAEIKIENPLLEVRGHEASLTQCLTNLLSNAVKFVARGVRPQVRIFSESRDDQVRLWFEDNGIGIPAEAQGRVFEMFQRIHSDSEYEGTGIGLAIVHKAISRMGGEVGVESQPGRGSRFWLQLPKARPPSPLTGRGLG